MLCAGMAVVCADVRWPADWEADAEPIAGGELARSSAEAGARRQVCARRMPLCVPLIAADPKAAEPRYLLAYALEREDKPADSLNEYTKAAALRPPTAAELRSVALDYVLLKDLTDAERWMSRSLAMDGTMRRPGMPWVGCTTHRAGTAMR